jgi:hypothetical protein
MNQTVVPGLSDIEGTMNLRFQVQLLGADEWRLCATACKVSNATIPGTWECIAGKPVNVGGCTIRFTPTFTSDVPYPIVDPDFTINFVNPSTTAQQFAWEVTSTFATGHTYGASGNVVPPLPDTEVLFGAEPSYLGILLRPAVLEQAQRLFGDSEADETVYGYLSYLASPVDVGSFINATTYFTGEEMSLEPTVGDGVVLGPNPGVLVTMKVIRDTSVTHFIMYVTTSFNTNSFVRSLTLSFCVLLVGRSCVVFGTIEMRRIHLVCY